MNKPKTAAGYPTGQVDLVKSTCLTVATVLGDLMNDLVVVGGLVPSLLVDQAKLPNGIDADVGTLDLDIGMSLAIFDNEHYQAITDRLRAQDFEPDENENGNQTSQRWRMKEVGKVTIDFLIPPSLPTDKGGEIRHLESDFAAIVAPGLDLAFVNKQSIEINGVTLHGENATRTIQVCGPGAYVVLKSLAFRNRGENKDAYDLYYVIRNYGNGFVDVAEQFKTLLPNERCNEAIEILRTDFSDSNSLGPSRATVFILGDGAKDEELQADVAGFVFNFLYEVSRLH